MFRRFTGIVILILVLTIGGTEAIAGPRIEFGPKVGANLPTVVGKDVDRIEALTGVDPGFIFRAHGGAFVSLKLNDYLAIQTEILYFQKGADWEAKSTEGDKTTTSTLLIGLEDIEIPVLMKFVIPQAGKFQPYLYAGPAVAFNVFSEFKTTLKVDSAGKKIQHDDYYSDNIYNAKGTAFDGIVGGGTEIKMGSNKLIFEARYTFSFGKVFDKVDDFDAVPEDDAVLAHSSSGEGLEMKHSVFSFIIGYCFSLGL